jgi:AAA family ATP:ADP antiporter
MLDRLLGWLHRLLDVRRGERRALAKAFATLLLLIAGHTALETARDALVLTRLPPRGLGVIYLAVAICVLPAAWVAARASERFGVRATLGGGLVTAAGLLVVLFAIPTRQTTSVVVYVVSALVGAILVPQYWNLLASMFNVAQARRLLGIVGTAAVLGGVLGSSAAAALLAIVRVKALLLVSASVFLVTVLVLMWTPVEERPLASQPTEAMPSRRATAALREEPFLQRIALLVVVATAAGLFVDYFFKWTITRTVPHDEIARFVATYYACLNGLSLVAQVFLTGALVRRIGVATTMMVTPTLLLLGGIGSLVTGGALLAVLVLKAVDGTLRNSVQRITMELAYLPVPAALRAKAKPFIDGALARVTQAAVGVVLLALGGANYLSTWLLAGIAVAALALWVVVAVTTRRPYLGLLRHAVTGDALIDEPEIDPIDLETAETLVEYLSHEDPLVVLGAMNVLARRNRERLIPALVLLHENDAVLVRALAIFGASTREDWVPRARHLLSHAREVVRTAAARALAMHGHLDAKDLPPDAGPRLHAYAALTLALPIAGRDAMDDPVVTELFQRPGHDGEEARLGLLTAIADASPNPKLARLLVALETRSEPTGEWTEGLARAAAAQRAVTLLPALISRLAHRDGREMLREALVALGPPAMDEVWATLVDTSRERRLRTHLPNTLARFGTKLAAERLLECIETEPDGLVRYKAIRGLGRLVSEAMVTVDRARVERLAYANLVEYFRLLGLRAPFTVRPPAHPALTESLLTGLLDDKLRQSLERTFRLLKIAHPGDDLHRVQIATVSGDSRIRANAGEFLDALLRRRDQTSLRELLLVVADELSMTEQVARASALLHTTPPATRAAALALLVDDADAALRALASLHAANVSGKPARVTIGGWQGTRPPVELSTAGDAALALREGDAGA